MENREIINKYLESIGIKFPTTKEGLNGFNKIHKDYEYSLTENCIDPNRIIKELKGVSTSNIK